MYGECWFTGKLYFIHGGSQNATLRSVNIPGGVEGLKSAATSRSLGNRGYVTMYRACKSRARKRCWGQLGAEGPYSPC